MTRTSKPPETREQAVELAKAHADPARITAGRFLVLRRIAWWQSLALPLPQPVAAAPTAIGNTPLQVPPTRPTGR